VELGYDKEDLEEWRKDAKFAELSYKDFNEDR